MSERKFWELVHPGAPRGLLTEKPEMKEQDSMALSHEGYAVVFFPRITGMPAASLNFPVAWETLSQTPEAAIAKFLDRIRKGEKWETYAHAGHKVRKIRVDDMGDA